VPSVANLKNRILNQYIAENVLGFEMKYKNIKKNSSVETYQDNLFLAVTDMFVEMVVNADINKKEARRLIIRDVNEIIDALEENEPGFFLTKNW